MSLLDLEDEIDVSIHLTHALLMMARAMTREQGNAVAEITNVLDQKLNTAKTAIQALDGRVA